MLKSGYLHNQINDMKKSTLILSLLLLVVTAFAQNTNQSKKISDNYFPKKGDWGTSIVVNGLIDNINLASNKNEYGSNILFARHYLKEDLVLRMGFGLTINSETKTTADSVGNTLVEVENSKSNYLLNFSGGLEKHLAQSNRLDPYLFGQLDLTFIGKTNEETDTKETSGAGTASTVRTIKEDGGIAFGLGGGIGFNYFLATRLSIGSEIGFGLQVVSLGGTVSDNEVVTPINGSSSTTFTSREDKTTTVNVDVKPNALINISYFFN